MQQKCKVLNKIGRTMQGYLDIKEHSNSVSE
jgi:hypothetical protein